MPRVKRGTTHSKRRRYLLKSVKGFKLGRKKLIKLAQTAATKAGAHAYTDRRKKKRNSRSLWNIKINAAARLNGTNYSTLIKKMNDHNVVLDRKILATLAEHHAVIFEKFVNSLK